MKIDKDLVKKFNLPAKQEGDFFSFHTHFQPKCEFVGFTSFSNLPGRLIVLLFAGAFWSCNDRFTEFLGGIIKFCSQLVFGNQPSLADMSFNTDEEDNQRLGQSE